MAIIATLFALGIPAIAAVRSAVRKSQTTAVIQGLQAVCEVYALEDPRYRLPPAEPDDTLRTALGMAGPRKTLDLLRAMGGEWRVEQLDREAPAGRALLDSWRRPIRYRPDSLMDGVMAKPAPRADWNAKAIEPYAYLWSLGVPSGSGDIADADPARSDRWIYRRTTP